MTSTQASAKDGRTSNVAWIARRPIAHRGLHDKAAGRFENTLSSARAAVEGGYAIEVDLHPSSDGVPMVFHDLELKRLTGEDGIIMERSAAELAKIHVGGTSDTIPTLRQLLDLVAGRSALVLELKGVEGRDDGFCAAVARVLEGYRGEVAIMSFDHWLLKDARIAAPHLPLGLTAEGKDEAYAAHRKIADLIDPDFVSYHVHDLPCRFVTEFRQTGRPVITWTVRSPQDKAHSDRHADQITFEGFDPR
jgi:glycerophosphoryl diester phosphodiesterase